MLGTGRRSSWSPSPSPPSTHVTPPRQDLVDGRPLHEATWELLLQRAGFVEVAPLPDATGTGRSHRPVRRRPLVSGIHHFVPVLHRGDAVGRHTLRLREATRARGFRSEIFVDTVDDDTADETVPVLSYPETAQPGDVVVYQFATASAMAPWLAGRSETLVVNYHNVTPPELMAPWDNHLALGQLRAQGDLRLLAPRTALAVADSGVQRGAPGRGRLHPDGGGLRRRPRSTQSPAPHRRTPTPTRSRRRGDAAPRRALAGRRPRVAQQGAREHRRGARRGPRPRRPRRDAAAHRQAGDRFLRRRAAALRRRARARRRRCTSPATRATPPWPPPMPRPTCWS